MQTTITGKAYVLGDNVDTDQIIPAQYLKRVERTGYGEFLFEEWRKNGLELANVGHHGGPRLVDGRQVALVGHVSVSLVLAALAALGTPGAGLVARLGVGLAGVAPALPPGGQRAGDQRHDATVPAPRRGGAGAGADQAPQAALVSLKILSISSILASSSSALASSKAPLVPDAPASLVASLNRVCSCGYFSKCGALK